MKQPFSGKKSMLRPDLGDRVFALRTGRPAQCARTGFPNSVRIFGVLKASMQVPSVSLPCFGKFPEAPAAVPGTLPRQRTWFGWCLREYAKNIKIVKNKKIKNHKIDVVSPGEFSMKCGYFRSARCLLSGRLAPRICAEVPGRLGQAMNFRGVAGGHNH